MNIFMSRKEFEALPFREDVEGPYREGVFYRAKAYRTLVFKRHGKYWDAYSVDIKDTIQDELDKYAAIVYGDGPCEHIDLTPGFVAPTLTARFLHPELHHQVSSEKAS